MLLEATDITVSFGGVHAVAGVSLGVDAEESIGIVGPNGSGKTSFLNALTGVVAATGTLTVAGVSVPLGTPARSRRVGLLRLFQAPQVFAELTCLENVVLSTSDRSGAGLAPAWLARPVMWRHERRRWLGAEASLELVGLGGMAQVPAALLPYGQQRLLDLARALAAHPTVLLLDEPSAGLNQFETRKLAELCNGLRADGLTLLVIDHKIDFIEAISDRVAVLELGRMIALGKPKEVWQDRRVMEAYLGASRA